jgi:hypothetical protein
MNKQQLLAGAAILIFILLIVIGNRNFKIRLLAKELDETKKLNRDIKQKLKAFIESNTDLDPRISSELGQILELIEIQQDTKAMLSLVKIVENLMRDIYEDDPRLKEVALRNNRKTPAFMDFLELARDVKAISKEEYHLMSVAKLVRDREAHEMNVEKEKVTILSSFISGIAIITALWKILRIKLLASPQPVLNA